MNEHVVRWLAKSTDPRARVARAFLEERPSQVEADRVIRLIRWAREQRRFGGPAVRMLPLVPR
jgi:hypothetical protein